MAKKKAAQKAQKPGPQKEAKIRRKRPERPMSWFIVLLMITIFQVWSAVQTIFEEDGSLNAELVSIFGIYIAIEWLYVVLFRTIFKKKSFELELIAFFLSGIGLVICASVYPNLLLKQFISVLLGLALFIGMVWFLGDISRVDASRVPMACAALLLLAVNLVLAKATNGALNWLDLGFVSIQPSEFVKLAFIFVGDATLDKLQSTRSLTKYILFSFACVGFLFLMYDLGAALIFFVTFLMMAFMRSGDIRTLIAVCLVALAGAAFIVIFKGDYVAQRFAAYRHVWEYSDGKGFQQTRVLVYMASGGLFGVGIGAGKLKNVFAATTDLVFGVLCEEWGLLLGIVVLLCFVGVTAYAVQCAPACRSSFYAIAACAAAGMMLFQIALNVFGITDLLPLTGVTLPFISRGGSSMICVWGLFAFIKAADVRTYPKINRALDASFSKQKQGLSATL